MTSRRKGGSIFAAEARQPRGPRNCTVSLSIAAGSVVVKPVPHNVTVAGVPAKIVGEAGCAEPSRTMDQMLGAIGL